MKIHCTKTVLYKDMIITEIFYYIAIRALLSISGTNVAPHITTLTKPLNRPVTLPKCERTMNEKIAQQLAHMDKLVFDLRMSLSALQSELHPSATYSTKVPVDQYNNTMFEASPQSRESPDEVNVKVSLTEPRYTGEAVLTDPDGFHGKSYKDYQKSCLADTVHKKNQVLPE